MPRVSKRKQISRKRKQSGKNKKPVKIEDDWSDFDQFMKTCLTSLVDNHKPQDSSSESHEKVDSDGFNADEFYVVLDKPWQYYENDNLDQFVMDKNAQLFSILKEDCRKLVVGEFDCIRNGSDVTFVQLYHGEVPKLKIAAVISSNFPVKISVNNKLLPAQHDIWNLIPRICVSAKSVEKVLKTIMKYNICIGNPDDHLQGLIPAGSYLDANGGPRLQGYRDTYSGTSTIVSTSCQLLVGSLRCKDCQHYRGTLRVLSNRNRARTESLGTPQKDWKSSKVNDSKLTTNQKLHKIKQLKTLASSLEKENAKLKKEINRQIKKAGVKLPDEQSSDLIQIMNQSEAEVFSNYASPESYQHLFWSQPKKYNELKDKRSMRWHPMLIKWCIFLKSKSSTTYDAIRKSGFINLPSERLLYDYTHLIKKGTGYKPEIVSMLHDEIYTKGEIPYSKKIVGILHDEIKIKSDLVYDKHSGELVGFVDLDKMGNQLNSMKEEMQKENKTLARYILVVMVRGLASNVKFPLAHFATDGVTSDQLFSILWKGVEILETDVGLCCLYITSDGASPNRRFVRLHRADGEEGVVYRTVNMFSEEMRYIYFISDAPHLLKTARNNLSNSFSHRKTRKLWKNGKELSWMHIVDLYKDHCKGMFRRCPKLSKAHIDITSFSCMKVSYAAQVLSSTVADALEMFYGEHTVETVRFIRHMDRFFDCMNTRCLGEAGRKRKDDLKEYRSCDDERLNYLLNDFLNYFKEWKESVNNRAGDFTQSERNAMQLSHQTLEGLEMTVRSVVACVKFSLEKGADFVLTEHFNHDPIEQHFGIHRSSGGCNTNPTLDQFNNSMITTRVVGSHAIAPIKGNTRRKLQLAPIDNTPLPKRKRPDSL